MTIAKLVRKILFPLFLLIAVTLFKLAFNAELGNRTPFLLYTAVIIGATWYSGWIAGLVMNLICLVILDYFFLEPYFSFAFTPRITTQMVIFSLQNLLIAAMGYSMTRALKRSEASENKFRLLVEHACELLVLRDASGKVIYVSPRVIDIFGYTPYEYLAMEVNRLFTPASFTCYQSCLTAILDDPGARKVLKLEFIRKNGSHGWLEVDLFNYQNEPGINALVSHCRDITSRVEMENQKASFIGVASHELKTPLTSIKAYLQVLENRALKTGDPFLSEALRKVNNQVKKMTEMINGFLNISRLESGMLEINKKEFDLNDLVEENLQEYRLVMPNREILFNHTDETRVFADREKISSVINNLISNAAKYSKAEKPIRITIILDSGQVQLNVQDEGMGVKMEDKPKLFDRYYRAHNEQTKVVSGFGIGLFLCAEIIKLHGGGMSFESEYGKGSTFYFRLPLAEQITT
jgi:two-component system sensor histidine kinase VicK